MTDHNKDKPHQVDHLDISHKLPNTINVELLFIDSEVVDVDDPGKALADVDGILVPGGVSICHCLSCIGIVRESRLVIVFLIFDQIYLK